MLFPKELTEYLFIHKLQPCINHFGAALVCDLRAGFGLASDILFKF